jgi:phosphate-selective porin OprO/OprP
MLPRTALSSAEAFKLRSANTWISAVATVLAIFLTPAVRADDLNDLKARLEAIEQENSLLRQDLNSVMMSDEQLAGRMSELNQAVGKKADKKEDDPLSFSAKWNNGFEAATKDKRFKFHVGGRVQLDAVFLSSSEKAFAGSGPFNDQDSVDFRRARLRADGTMYETIDWVAEFDFVNSTNLNPGTVATESGIAHVTAPTDLWVNFREVPLVSNIRVGNVKEPIGLEHLHSSRYLDFMERSFNQDAFYGPFNNGFTPGLLFFDTWAEEHGTWATGVFKNTTNAYAYGIGNGEYAWTSRATYLPWYEDEGKYLAHIGVSGSLRDPNNTQTLYRARGSLRNGPGGANPILASTGNFTTDQVRMLSFESILQMDSLLLEAEYTAAWNKDAVGNGTTAPLGAALGDVMVYGYYVQALYFLTGEHREYEKKQGVFGRVVPHQNFGHSGSLGAWQVGARYAHLNLMDSGMDGGNLEDVTLGLNWFLNPNMKIQHNYVYTMRDAQASPGGGSYTGYGIRLAWDF